MTAVPTEVGIADGRTGAPAGGRRILGGGVQYLCWIAVACLTTYMVLVGGTYTGIGDSTLRVFADGAIAVVFIAWFLVAWRRPSWRPTTRLWPVVLAVLAAFSISTVFAWSPRISADYLAYAAVCAALYLLLNRLLAHPFFAPRVLALVVVLAGAIDVAYIVAVGRDWVAWWQLVGRVAAAPLRPAGEALTFASPNIVATMAVLLTATAVAHVGWQSRRTAVFAVALSLLALVAVIVSGSRGAVVGVGVGVAACVVAWTMSGGLNRLSHGRLRGTLSRRAGLSVAVVVALGLAGLARVAGAAILDRVSLQGADFRATFAQVAFRMFESSPLVGLGPGSFAVRRALFTHPGELDLPVPHAHDIYAQTLAEFGLAGVAAGLIMIVCLVVLVRACLRQRMDPRISRLAYAALFGLVYLATQQTVDFMVNLPCVLFAIAVPVASLDVASSRRGMLARWERRLPRPVSVRAPLAVVAAAAVACLVFLGWSDAAAMRADAATQAADRGDWQVALSDAESAVGMDAAMPPYHLTLGLAMAHAGLWREAEAQMLLSAQADDAPEAWLDIADVRLRTGDTSGAQEALNAALRLGDQREAILAASAVMWNALGHANRAHAALAAVILSTPSIVADRYWQTSSALVALRDASVDSALANAPPAIGWQIALYADRPSYAAQLASVLPVNARPAAQQVLAAWSGDETARAELEDEARRHPLDLGTVAWCATLAQHSGQAQLASSYWLWIAYVTGAPGAPPQIAQPGNDPSLREAGEDLGWQAGAMYRRTWPRDVLVPGLPLLVQ